MVRNPPHRKDSDYLIFAQHRRAVGRYSGATRDFSTELVSIEPDMDDFRQWLKDLNLKGSDYEGAVDRQWKEWTDKEGGWDFDDGRQIYWCGQSHIDIAWEWRLGQTIAKTLVTYSKAAYHCENIPNFCFAGSQSITYEFVRQRDPELFQHIQELVKRGKWDLVGGSWVEPDCRMPSGESFIRQRLYGQHYYLKHFGVISRVEWTPDTFGYAWSMPQIIKKSGGDAFFTTKIWGNREEFPDAPWPYTNFMWRSPDGSEVLTHVQPQMFYPIAAWPGTRPKSNLVKENEKLVADYTVDRPDMHPLLSDDPNDYVRELGIFYGLGDGGHGPTGKEVAVVERWISQGKGEYKNVHDYFDLLHKYESRLPVWNDELYFHVHQGTLTTHGLVKRCIRKLEWRTAGLEALCTLEEMAGGMEFPYAPITQVWKDILTNQFHDIMPGSSIQEVYDDSYDHFIQDVSILDRIETELVERLFSRFTKDDGDISENKFIIANPMGFKRTAVVGLPVPKVIGERAIGIQIQRIDGSTMEQTHQFIPGDDEVTETMMKRPNRLEFVLSLNPYEICLGSFVTKEPSLSQRNQTDISPIDFCVKEMEGGKIITVQNGNIITTIEGNTGTVSSCKWKGRELFSGSAFVLDAYFDFANSWEIQFNFRDNRLEWDRVTPAKVVENGPLRIMIEYRAFIEDGESEFIHQLSFYRGIDAIFSTVIVDWQDPNILIKMSYPLSYSPDISIAEIPGAVTTRKTKPVASHDKARWEVSTQTFTDMPAPDKSWGVSFLNDGKYGYTVHEDKYELSLLRKAPYSGIAKEAWCHAERNELRAKGKSIPMTGDGHWHVIHQVVMPHESTIEDANIPSVAHGFNTPVIARMIARMVKRDKRTDGKNQTPSIYASTPALEIMAIKPWEPVIAQGKPGYVVRLVNTTSKPIEATIHIAELLQVTKVNETDLLEREITIVHEVTVKAGTTTTFKATWKPYEFKTFLLQ